MEKRWDSEWVFLGRKWALMMEALSAQPTVTSSETELACPAYMKVHMMVQRKERQREQ